MLSNSTNLTHTPTASEFYIWNQNILLYSHRSMNLCCHKCVHLAGWNCTAQGHINKLIGINITIVELGRTHSFIPLTIRRIWCYIKSTCVVDFLMGIGSDLMIWTARTGEQLPSPTQDETKQAWKRLPRRRISISARIQAEKDARYFARSDHALHSEFILYKDTRGSLFLRRLPQINKQKPPRS